MFKFFRAIRQRLLSENKVRKYTLYALGEILLVVMGILIALQVNNWNEKRKQRQESKEIYAALNTEFQSNRLILKERIDLLETANKNVDIILRHINKSAEDIRSVNMDSIILHSTGYGNYNPANSTIQELISSGKLSLIREDKLKQNLFNWLQTLEDSDEDFRNQDLQHQTQLNAYFAKNISIKNLARQANVKLPDSRPSELFDSRYSKIFADLEFENLYYFKLYWNNEMIRHYKDLDALAAKIIEQTE